MMQEFVQAVTQTIRDNLKGVHTAIPGKILDFDAEKGLATVLPAMKFKKPDGKKIDFPQITGVPIVFPQSMNQAATVAYPIKPGDGCLIIVAEQSIDYWMYGQETDTDLGFDLTNAICIPGLFKDPSDVMKEACEKNAIIVDLKGTKVTVHNEYVRVDVKDPRITAKKEVVELDVNGTKVAVKDGLVQIDAKEIVINGNTTVNGNFTTNGGIVNLNSGGKRAARMGDTVTGMTSGEHSGHEEPHGPSEISGEISDGCSEDVFINVEPAAVAGSITTEMDDCCGGGEGTIAAGSSSVFINGKPAARDGDALAAHDGEGAVSSGSEDVLIGG